jgi:hypothetical protein
MSEDLVRALVFQAQACDAMGSPLNGGLLRRASDDVSAGGPMLRLLAAWSGTDTRQLIADALPLRLVAAFHDLVLSGDAPDLAAAYARQIVALDPDAAWAAVTGLMEREAARLSAFMGHEPQTNEVRRALCLVGGFLTIAQETGLPLRCFEIGASAGLNSAWDRFFYRLGDRAWGDPASPVRLEADWTGPTPPVEARIEVVERAACDRRPTDLANLAERRRLLSYIWADQLERLARARAAIGVALADGVVVEAADAVEWAERKATPGAGAATVLFHSVFWQYLPPERQATLRRTIEAKGAQATAEAPFAWLRMEPPPEDLTRMEVILTLWPGGEARTLAHVHPHGARVAWLA